MKTLNPEFAADRKRRGDAWRAANAKADAILARGPVVSLQKGDGANRADRRHAEKHRNPKCPRCLHVARIVAAS